MEWARLQQVSTPEQKILLLLLADRSDGSKHECGCHVHTLVKESGIPGESFEPVVRDLERAGLIEAGKLGPVKNHPNDYSPPTTFRLLIPARWRTFLSGVPKREVPVESRPTAVYRLYSQSGVLLYVGISDNPEKRFTEHERSQYWWREVATREVEWHVDRFSAAAEEDRVIAVEQPEYNMDGATRSDAQTHAQRARHRRYMVTRSRFDRFKRTAEALRADIRARRFPDGFLPSASELQQMYGVDDTTVRQVLHFLASNHVITVAEEETHLYWWRRHA